MEGNGNLYEDRDLWRYTTLYRMDSSYFFQNVNSHFIEMECQVIL